LNIVSINYIVLVKYIASFKYIMSSEKITRSYRDRFIAWCKKDNVSNGLAIRIHKHLGDTSIGEEILNFPPRVNIHINFCNNCGVPLSSFEAISDFYNYSSQGLALEHTCGMSIHHCGKVWWYCNLCISRRDFRNCDVCQKRPGYIQEESILEAALKKYD
jgi:hypothetical protein